MIKYYSKYEIGEVVEKELTKMMRGFDFQVDPYDDIMYKYFNEYYDIYSRYHISENNGFFYKQEGLTKRINFIDTVWEDLSDIIQIQKFKHRPTISLYMSFCFPEIVNQPYYDDLFRAIKSPATDEGIEQYIKVIQSVFENYIFPASEKFNDIREIDSYVNSTIEISQEIFGFLGGQDGALYRKIIIARLADNPLFNEIIEYYRENFAKVLQNPQNVKQERIELYKKRFEVFEEVIKRLKDVAPLDNPILT